MFAGGEKVAEQEEGCLACETVHGACPEDEVYRDENLVAVVARRQINPGHLVVVTREHVRSLIEMDDALACQALTLSRTLAKALLRGLGCPGVMLVWNNGEPCQTVFHAHLHVVPRWHGDEMDVSYGRPSEAAERRAQAELLRAALERGGPE